MQSRFALVLMSVAGAALLFCAGLVFGLGVISTPKGGQHKEIAVTNAPVKIARRETTGAGNPEAALTPLTPVHPGTPAQAANASAPQTPPSQPAPAPPVQASAQSPQAAATQAAATPAPAKAVAETQKPAEPAPKPVKAVADTAPAPSKPALADKTDATPANATPVALHAKNSCDIQACARAYKSFRESDCTYQPYSGPRQLCVSPPGTKEASHEAAEHTTSVHIHRGARDIEVQNVPTEGESVTDGASSGDEDRPVLRRRYSRDITADGEDDGIDDSRVIVRRSDDRGYTGDGWHRRFFAPVEDDEDDQ